MFEQICQTAVSDGTQNKRLTYSTILLCVGILQPDIELRLVPKFLSRENEEPWPIYHYKHNNLCNHH